MHLSKTQQKMIDNAREKGSIEHDKFNGYGGCDGKCTSCGMCCACTLPMTAQDAKTVWKYVKKHKIEPMFHVTVDCDLDNIPADYKDAWCPFCDMSLPKDHCMIYEARPAICRAFQCCAQSESVAPVCEAADNGRKLRHVDLWDMLYEKDHKTLKHWEAGFFDSPTMHEFSHYCDVAERKFSQHNK